MINVTGFESEPGETAAAGNITIVLLDSKLNWDRLDQRFGYSGGSILKNKSYLLLVVFATYYIIANLQRRLTRIWA